jgi:hypothetical protein
MAVIPFATNSYPSASRPLSAQRVVNMFVETEGPDKKAPRPVFGAPGLTRFSQIGAGPIRGMWVMADQLFGVSGTELYTIDTNGNGILLGGNIAGNANVSMSDNGKQLCIVNSAKGFIWSQAAGYQPITSSNFYPASTVTFFDDVFVFDKLGTNQIFISGILDGTAYNGADFASAEVKPATVLAVLNNHETLLIFTKKIIESWYDAGATNFPFQRYDGGTIERGLGASHSVVEEDNSVFFLGNDGIYYRLDFPIPKRVSTHGTEFAWSKYATTSDATAFSYTYNGHKFINLTFPSGPATWVFDIATNEWHERESIDANYNSLKRWRGNCFANAYGRLLVGDAFSNTIAFLDPDTYTELGVPMIGSCVAPPIHSDRKRVFMSRYELDVEAGVGLTTGQGSDPQIMLDWSDDGGHTWSGVQQWSSLGRIGEYRHRMRWLRKGQARERIIRATMSDPVKRTILAAHADLAPGAN